MSEVHTHCLFCGLPYSLHDHSKDNWLACPTPENLARRTYRHERRNAKFNRGAKA